MADLLRPLWERADARQAVYTADEAACWSVRVFDRLLALGLFKAAANATSVVCDACGGDHVEEVLLVESPPGTGLRAYIWCPEAGRVSVPLERLRQWAVDFHRLTELVASALATSGDVEEVIPSRVWLLGKATLAGQPREVFLASGLTWPDAPAVVGQAGRLLASPHPVVLVPGSIPGADVWKGVIPTVLPLAAVLSLDGAEPVLDRAHLEAAVAPGKKAKTPTLSLSFPTPHGATWEDIRITVADHRLVIDLYFPRFFNN